MATAQEEIEMQNRAKEMDEEDSDSDDSDSDDSDDDSDSDDDDEHPDDPHIQSIIADLEREKDFEKPEDLPQQKVTSPNSFTSFIKNFKMQGMSEITSEGSGLVGYKVSDSMPKVTDFLKRKSGSGYICHNTGGNLNSSRNPRGLHGRLVDLGLREE